MLTRRKTQDDSGVGLILVIGISGIVFGLIATALVLATNALNRSQVRTNFELAMAAADDGVDTTLARLQQAYDDLGLDFPVPGTQSGTVCNAAPVVLPTPPQGSSQPFSTEAAERSWARGQLDALLAAHPECVATTESGQYLVLKPETTLNSVGTYSAQGRVYSMGWSPGVGEERASSRLVKVEYQFLPYKPSHAILTQGNLDLSSSATVTVAQGGDPTSAGVHANGTITGSGNPTVYGEVSSTGVSTMSSSKFYDNPGGAVVQTPEVTIPRVSATSFYHHAPNLDLNSVSSWWTDLCPDGLSRPYSVDGPCDPTESGSPAPMGTSYDAGTHTWNINNNTAAGVYFAHQANATTSGNGSFTNITVIASAANPDDCATKQYGNITWDHNNLQVPAFTNTFLFADSDLITTSNFYAGSDVLDSVQSGMFVAGDQLRLDTSSQFVVGSVVAGDQCSTSPNVTSNQVQNVVVTFDPDGKSPFTSVINQTLWIEYVG